MSTIRNTAARAGVLLFVGLWGAVLIWGLPFVSGGPVDWEVMNGQLLCGTAVMVVMTFWLTAANFSAGRAVVFWALAFFTSWGAEVVGTRSPFPFGHQYIYHPELRPALPGNVPLFIPLAWWVLASTPLILLRDMTTREDRAASRPRRLLLKAIWGGLFLAGCALALDPLGTSVQAWTWLRAGGYFGTPYTNFVGWFVVGVAIYVGYFWFESMRERPLAVASRRLDVVWTAANMVFLVLLGVASYNRLGSLLPALLSFSVMGPFWARWLMLLGTRDPRLADAGAIRCISTDTISS